MVGEPFWLLCVDWDDLVGVDLFDDFDEVVLGEVAWGVKAFNEFGFGWVTRHLEADAVEVEEVQPLTESLEVEFLLFAVGFAAGVDVWSTLWLARVLELIWEFVLNINMLSIKSRIDEEIILTIGLVWKR